MKDFFYSWPLFTWVMIGMVWFTNFFGTTLSGKLRKTAKLFKPLFFTLIFSIKNCGSALTYRWFGKKVTVFIQHDGIKGFLVWKNIIFSLFNLSYQTIWLKTDLDIKPTWKWRLDSKLKGLKFVFYKKCASKIGEGFKEVRLKNLAFYTSETSKNFLIRHFSRNERMRVNLSSIKFTLII